VAENESFAELIRGIRTGDADAATRLVRQYEPEIRRLIRVRLTSPRLGRTLDSMDVCQSVLGNFFVRAAAGQFDLKRPEQLLHLLMKMASNRLRDHARRMQAQRRDGRRLEEAGQRALDAAIAPVETPSQIVAGRELLREVQRRLAPEERYLAEQRALGRDWADLAAELGAGPEALRKRLARALDRVLGELGVDTPHPEH
jgi:RNA polymerase sigma-70 factor (ECF subfamily)